MSSRSKSSGHSRKSTSAELWGSGARRIEKPIERPPRSTVRSSRPGHGLELGLGAALHSPIEGHQDAHVVARPGKEARDRRGHVGQAARLREGSDLRGHQQDLQFLHRVGPINRAPRSGKRQGGTAILRAIPIRLPAMHVLFVAPYAMETTLRFVRAAARLPGVRLGIVSQQARSAFDKDVDKSVDFERVDERPRPRPAGGRGAVASPSTGASPWNA